MIKVTPAEALKLINSGKTVRYKMTDGHCEIKKAGRQYIFRIVTEDEESIYTGNIQNLIKTLNDKEFKDTLYI